MIRMQRSIFNFVILMLIVNISGNNFTNSTLRLIHMVFRHGDRNPTETYKNDPYITYNWPGDWGSLTNEGKLQMYKLGLKIRQRYSNFLKESYSSDDVYVLSSYADRCQMSAQCLLAALYPPKNEQIWFSDLLWQPIPVHSLPRSQDNIIAMKQNCTKYDISLKEAYESDRIQLLNKDNLEIFEYISFHAGQPMNTITDLEFFYNTLEIEKQQGLKLPTWTDSIFNDKLKTIAAESLAIFTQTDYMKRMKGGVFIKEVIQHMLAFRGKSSRVKQQLYLYSGHDITLVNVLRSLGFVELLKPDYGAHLVIELHEQKADYFVKMLYYDNYESTNPKDLILPQCGTNCTLDNYIKILQPVVPINWYLECQS